MATHARERAFILDQRNEGKMISTKVDKESSRKEANLKWKKTLALQQMETKGVQKKRRLTSVSDKCMEQECKTEDKDF